MLAFQQRNWQETYNSRHNKASASWNISCGTYVEHNNTRWSFDQHTHTTNKGTHRPEHLRRCGLGRMPKHKKINKRIHRDNDGTRRTIRQQNTSSGSTIIGRIRTIRNRHRGTRRPTHSQLHKGSNHNKSEHPHTHRQHKRKEHRNKNRVIQEGKTHWPEVPIHTTTGTERNTINPQNQHTRQPSGHTHKVCPGRGAQQTPLYGGHPQPTTSQLTAGIILFHNIKASPACTIHTHTHGCSSHGTLFS